MQELVEKIKKEIGPLRISVTSDQQDHIYYLEINGTRTYPVAQYWNEKWGKSFVEFAVMIVNRHAHKKFNDGDVKVITPTHIKIRLGSVLDFVKDA